MEPLNFGQSSGFQNCDPESAASVTTGLWGPPAESEILCVELAVGALTSPSGD